MRWVSRLIVAMFVALALVAALPQRALWIPHTLGCE
ncbi:TRAP-type C4-dicarboxylate transport system, large permease component [Azospirillum argentinense]